MIKAKDIIRFNKKHELNGDCWQWRGKPDTRGYGRIIIDNKSELAHKISFIIHNQREPIDYLQHSCNNPLCVNPNHIYEGKNSGRPKRKGAEAPPNNAK